MADQPPEFRVIVQARGKPAGVLAGTGEYPEGTYTYVITKSDDRNWAETSADSYATPEDASAAGQIALERLLLHQRATRP